eukprot:7431329-Lingulodinium_polyedra.AAC.1
MQGHLCGLRRAANGAGVKLARPSGIHDAETSGSASSRSLRRMRCYPRRMSIAVASCVQEEHWDPR